MKMPSAVLQLIVVSFIVIVLSIFYFTIPAYTTRLYPACIFHKVTGLYCPGCGSQRAGSALLHGNMVKAIGYNVLFVACLPLIGYAAFVFTWNVFSRKKLSQPIFYSPLFVKALLAMIIIFTVLRNIPLAPFNWLAPH